MTGPQDPLDSTYRVRVPTCFPKATREPSGLPLQGLGKSGESNWDLVLYTGFLGQTYQLQRKDIPSNTGDASGPCDLCCFDPTPELTAVPLSRWECLEVQVYGTLEPTAAPTQDTEPVCSPEAKCWPLILSHFPDI